MEWFFATGGQSRLVVATSNKGKLQEITRQLSSYIADLRSINDFDRYEVKETGTSYRANALLKARLGFKHSGWASLADDSGFEVIALNNKPGLLSARWAEDKDGVRDFSNAIARVNRELEQQAQEKNIDDYSARFVCALAMVRADGAECVVQGKVEGRVVFPPKGENGFGYDPIFIASGENKTFGEMTNDAKERISHRTKAFSLLCKKCFASKKYNS